MERRYFNIEFKSNAEERKIIGIASSLNRSYDMGSFDEEIDMDAFNDADFSEAAALFNHDQNIVLGRVKNTKGGVENAFQHRLRAFALNLCKTVQQEIDDGNFAPLEPSTIAKKKREGYPLDILIETGQLRNKLQWMVISPKAYGKNKVVIGNVNDTCTLPSFIVSPYGKTFFISVILSC